MQHKDDMDGKWTFFFIITPTFNLQIWVKAVGIREDRNLFIEDVK